MKYSKTIFGRILFMVLMVALEILIVFSIFHWFGENVAWIAGILRLFSVLIVLAIINNSVHLSSDLMWILVIIAFPVPGTAVFLLLGANLITSRTFRNIIEMTANAKKYYVQDETVMHELETEASELRGQFHYIAQGAGFPFYRNTGFDYYGLGDTGYPVMLEEMRKAEKFIFLEYFIIAEGKMWDGMMEILEEKAAAGVDVRVMYDDLGSFTTLSASYAKRLEAEGIKCTPFNRINPVIGSIMNHRDHRKIMVIDGKVAFSGGINLADEYINAIEKYGHWKDNVIRITGEAVWSYTVMFLTHWNAIRREDDDYLGFRAEALPGKQDGYIAAYGETPLDGEITAQNIYMNILNQSNDYCYIYTPYLIIDTELINALTLAAKRGVDVRIMTPGVPDKKLVWKITRSYYAALIRGGVKIYEYTPGFVHSKVFVADDRMATVGTVNLDYRSLYLHFENGTYLYGSKKILGIKKDFMDALKESHLMSREECRSGFFVSILRIFAPLL